MDWARNRGRYYGSHCLPMTLQALVSRIGFAWSIHVIALINLVLLIIANLFIRSRLPPQKATKKSILPDIRSLRDPVFALTTFATFFVERDLYVPLSYFISDAPPMTPNLA